MIVKINGEEFNTKSLEIIRGGATYRIEDWDMEIITDTTDKSDNNSLLVSCEKKNPVAATLLRISPLAFGGIILGSDEIMSVI